MTRYEKGFIEKCAEYGIMEKKAFTALQLLTVLGLVGTPVAIGERAAYKHNPEGFKKGTRIGAASTASAFGVLAGKNQIRNALKGSGTVRQRALKALGLTAAAAGSGAAVGSLVGGPVGSFALNKKVK